MGWIGVIWFVGHGPIAAALIVVLFWAALARPNRIRSVALFRLAVLCLSAAVTSSIVVPLVFLVHFTEGGRSEPREPSGFLYLYTVPAILTMLTILLGLDSVLVRQPKPEPDSQAPPTEPQ